MELPSSDDEALEAPVELVPVYDSSSDEEVPIGIRFDIPMGATYAAPAAAAPAADEPPGEFQIVKRKHRKGQGSRIQDRQDPLWGNPLGVIYDLRTFVTTAERALTTVFREGSRLPWKQVNKQNIFFTTYLCPYHSESDCKKRVRFGQSVDVDGNTVYTVDAGVGICHSDHRVSNCKSMVPKWIHDLACSPSKQRMDPKSFQSYLADEHEVQVLSRSQQVAVSNALRKPKVKVAESVVPADSKGKNHC